MFWSSTVIPSIRCCWQATHIRVVILVLHFTYVDAFQINDAQVYICVSDDCEDTNVALYHVHISRY